MVLLESEHSLDFLSFYCVGPGIELKIVRQQAPFLLSYLISLIFILILISEIVFLFYFILFLFLRQSHYIILAGLELNCIDQVGLGLTQIPPAFLPMCWDYRYASPCLVSGC